MQMCDNDQLCLLYGADTNSGKNLSSSFSQMYKMLQQKHIFFMYFSIIKCFFMLINSSLLHQG